MSFKGQNELLAILSTKVKPFDANRMDSAKYELSLGEKYYTTDNDSFKVQKASDDQIVINPGQFCFLETLETINIPDDCLGLISIKASKKFRGLINVSGFHVDPGFKGKLIYSVYNAGSNHINLTVGDPLFQLWLADVSSPSPYSGSHQNQIGITGDLISKYFTGNKTASPSELKREIDELKSINKRNDWLFKLIIGLFITIVVRLLWGWIPPSKQSIIEEVKLEIFKELKEEELKAINIEAMLDSMVSVKLNSLETKQDEK